MWEFIQKLGSDPDDSAERRMQKFTVLIIALTCSTAAPLWSLTYVLLGMPIPALGPAIYFLCVVPAIIHFAITRNEKPLINIQLFAIFFCPMFMQWSSGGFISGGVVILWSFLAPLSALLFHDISKAKLWLLTVIICILGTAIFDDFFKHFGHQIDSRYTLLIIAMNLIGPSLVIYFAMQYFVKSILSNSKLLLAEKLKSDTLLLNILPHKIAEELKLTGKASPMKYNASTVIFSDFKDFTKISEQLTPEQLVDELDDCFRAFDEIIASYGIEKIKTIGDAYMCVAGIPDRRDDATLSAISAALQMAEYVKKVKEERRKEGKPYWNIRIGVHTGDVVAGIVGKNKFAYDIWGDAVNTASRMESSGEEGKVNISGTTYELIKNYFNCTYRGKIPAKNKGVIDMYFVEGALN